MISPSGRREQRKAQTRAEIRSVAQRLFNERGFDAVTMADVASAAGVAVQTVFNHFAGKEELFFDGRTPWIDTPARVVRERTPGSSPVALLRQHVQHDVCELIEHSDRREERAYYATILASASLLAREWELSAEGVGRLAAALADSMHETGAAPASEAVADPLVEPARWRVQVWARLTAELFYSSARAVVQEQRTLLMLNHEQLAARHHAVRALVESTLARVEEAALSLAGDLDVRVPGS